MTSKEAIEYLRNNTKFYEPVNREAFRTIEKDLERLELLEKAINILKPYCYIEWDEINDEFYFNVDDSERIPLSEDYNVNRCIIGLNNSEIDTLKEVF